MKSCRKMELHEPPEAGFLSWSCLRFLSALGPGGSYKLIHYALLYQLSITQIASSTTEREPPGVSRALGNESSKITNKCTGKPCPRE